MSIFLKKLKLFNMSVLWQKEFRNTKVLSDHMKCLHIEYNHIQNKTKAKTSFREF